MKKMFVAMLLIEGLVALTGCGNYGTEQDAKGMASQFLNSDLNPSWMKINDEVLNYDNSTHQWDAQGMVQYNDDSGYHAYNFEIVMETTDGKMWKCDSLNLTH